MLLFAAVEPLEIPAPLRLAALAAWVAALALVVAFSLHPDVGPPHAFHLDKAFHLLAYAVLAALPFGAFRGPRPAWRAALAMLPLGLALEALQELVPGRYGDPLDAVANAAGVALGLALGPAARRLATRMR